MKFLMLPIFTTLFCVTSKSQNNDLQLWYNKPAEKWTEALPIGNGHLGAMIYGGVGEDRIQFNESTLWSDGPRDYNRKGAYQYLEPIRKLLAEGKQKEAEELAQEHFMGLRSNEKGYETRRKEWLQKVKGDVIISSPQWNNAQWESMQLPTLNGWETAGLEGLDGAVWFKTTFALPDDWQGKELLISLGKIRDLDITYINGKQIGSTEDITTNRLYSIPANLLKKGINEIEVQVINYFDKGGFAGTKGDREIFAIYPKERNGKESVKLKTVWEYWIQNDDAPAMPRYQADYQPFGELQLSSQVADISEYRRTLDISNAVSTVAYKSGNVTYTKEYLANYPDNVIAVHLKASGKGNVNYKATFTTVHKNYSIRKIDDHTLALDVAVKNGAMKATAYLYVDNKNGRVEVADKALQISNSDEATLYMIAATNFKNYRDVSADANAICKAKLAAVKKLIYEKVKAAHIADYKKYFDKFSLQLNGGIANSGLPTDERIKQFSITNDPALLTLYVQYARYLMLSSSRQGTNAANLQGIWNDLLTPPWGSKYTTNINLQMNYWPSESLNLSACTPPLFKLIKEVAEAGKETAKEYYNAPGFVLHHNTDQWRGTAPINASNHGIWVTGGAWLSSHLWEHYLFTRDKTFLQNEAYPVMKAAADFFVHFLVKDESTGWLISTPSNSPEHGGLVAGPTMDHQIIRELFSNTIEAAKALGVDESFRKKLLQKYDSIAPNQIGKYGQLQEWLQDKDDSSDTHRHVSHLWGVYPGKDITWNNEKMMKAARQSLLYRGDDGTGWSIAWKVNLWARFKDGDHAMKMLQKLLSDATAGKGSESGGVYPNLFDAHPPFQIDGNFGGAAGVAEMLVQSHMGYVELLPALPSTLPGGVVKGICARGNFTINMQWEKGKLMRADITSNAGSNCIVKCGDRTVAFKTVKGKTYSLDQALTLIQTK
ncbi:glycoside hydrolase family 95 protein [Pinibacter aurantiacus]|uniref:Glycoside hydrolase family 95 protein n=1 Tax=Pinibacter aurantiacus TaxID=2851599 RepID=A0A9E2W807_9BACT|nr:glycoside hydrolase family 95 protein [Pinibacter aurantiacus]MBV4357631.1 glycoside hydrolase family 95 protein [Pinibacter aurantiacus]